MRNAVALVMLMLLGAPVQASQKCSDILSGGTMQRTEVHSNNYFRQVIEARFASLSYQEARSKREFGLDVPVGELVLGTSFSEDTFNRKRDEIRQSLDVATVERHRLDYLLQSGDDKIIGAWSQCMARQAGGLSLRLEAESATIVSAIVEWFPAAGVTETTLSRTSTMPSGVRIEDNPSCFEKGTQIRASLPCIATLTLDSARTTALLNVHSQNGSDKAFLAPRLRLRQERQPHWSSPPDMLLTLPPFKERTYRMVEVPAVGWKFDPRSAAASFVCEVCPALARCYDPPRSDATEYGWTVDAVGGNGNTGSSASCRLNARIDEVKESWVPADEPLR